MTLTDIFDSADAKTHTYKAKDFIVLPGDRPRDAYLIESGKVRQFQIRDNGSEVVVNVYGPGATLSLAWILNDGENEYFFQAIEPTTTRVVSARVISDALATDPSLAFETLGRLVRGFDGMYQRLIVHGSNKSLQRVMAELVIEAKRFGTFETDSVFVKISSSELAARTGMTREATSRALHTLESAERISIDKGGYTLSLGDLG